MFSEASLSTIPRKAGDMDILFLDVETFRRT
jgi:hypothetical protein